MYSESGSADDIKLLLNSGFIGFTICLGQYAAVGFLVFIISIIFAFIALTANMLILNILANVQIIRKNAEKSVTWRCPCAAVNKNAYLFCANCGRTNPSVKQKPPAEPKQSWQCAYGAANRETDAFCSNCGKKSVKI